MLAGYDLVYFASKDVTSADNDATARIPSYATSDICLAYAPSGDKFEGLETDVGVYDVLKSPVSRMAGYGRICQPRA